MSTESGNGRMPIKIRSNVSPKLAELMNRPCWYHGTQEQFPNWVFPPPPKKDEPLLVLHSAIFFTSNMEFAEKAGSELAVVTLSSNAKILDATHNYYASEKLRKAVSKNEMASRTLNVTHDFWHNGWKDGSVLRVNYTDPIVEAQLTEMIFSQAVAASLPLEVAQVMVIQNLTRGLIELICKEAKKIGFDAIYGHEIDRHTQIGTVFAQPWLAVLRKGVVSNPTWLQ